MSDTEKFLGFLGLCARAGKLQSGDEAARIAIKNGTAKLCIWDKSASARTQKDIESACKYYNIPYAPVDGDIGSRIGKPGRMVVVILDKGFANTMIKMLEI
ncbi:MAG: hypothetical protein E7334_03055 [Clostridiales bacterium]|nr:hypothetical protein [Clostridiales bacterium]MBQ2818722.1 ribosomal L7Ae/L30e/S12e/Gadd45 family protein [Clostridia bacterium]MBQ4637887.1 ribosomal L7Ae/L30e/S12e/Gadd45 family protein [Clostridia bacterium]